MSVKETHNVNIDGKSSKIALLATFLLNISSVLLNSCAKVRQTHLKETQSGPVCLLNNTTEVIFQQQTIFLSVLMFPRFKQNRLPKSKGPLSCANHGGSKGRFVPLVQIFNSYAVLWGNWSI